MATQQLERSPEAVSEPRTMSDEPTSTETDQRGFILQPTYRIVGGRPIVHLWGRLETDETFLVRDRRCRPYFYVRDIDADRAAALGAGPLTATKLQTLRSQPVVLVEVPTPPETPALRDRLHDTAIPTYEADIRFAMRYLIDLGVQGSALIRGPSRPGEAADRVYDEPELEPADWTPSLRALSLDIETDPQARRLLSIALYGAGAAEVLLYCPSGWSCPTGAVGFESERALFEGFCRRVRELDPDVLLGWNVIGFDLTVLVQIGQRLGATLRLGRDGGPTTLRPARGRNDTTEAIVPGRVVLDGIQLLRGAFIKMERYGLDAVAQAVLGEGKVDLEPAGGGDKAGEILRLFKEDRARLVDYNLTDARLALEIVERLRLIELAVARSQLTGLPPDRVSSAIAAFDFLYLAEMNRRGLVAPTAGQDRGQEQEVTGGHVLEPRPGLTHNVLVFDFKSLYPSLIRTFHIDPLGVVDTDEVQGEAVIAPNGVAFRRGAGVLPELLDRLVPRREEAKAAGDRVTAQAVKILMNSFYGVLGAPSCRFFNPKVANAVTSFGREVLLWSRDWMQARGLKVLYGDTDSLFVASALDDPAAARSLGVTLVAELNQALAEHVADRWAVESQLELELEGLFLTLVLPPLRRSQRGSAPVGARKRYAGRLEADGEVQTVFKGLEVVRRDWTELARRSQGELYERLFEGRPVESYLRQLVASLRAGELDHLLIYHKSLRKNLSEYTATTPPHVAAARKLEGPPPRIVDYVITRDGPEPLSRQTSPLDYDHYLERQLRPVAEPVLDLLDLEFDEVSGEKRQMSLF